MNGWLVRVTVPGEPPSVRLFAVAESEPKRALFLVNTAVNGSPPRDRIETVKELSSTALEGMGLKSDEVRDVTDSPPDH